MDKGVDGTEGRTSNPPAEQMIVGASPSAQTEQLADDADGLRDAYEDRVEIGLHRIEEATVDASGATVLEADGVQPFSSRTRAAVQLQNTRAAALGVTACRSDRDRSPPFSDGAVRAAA